MTVISSYKVDNSTALVKRFAALTQSYFDHPRAAKNNAAQVPLENIYRILEMFRYGSFEHASLSFGEPHWHKSIVDALNHAILTVFVDITTERAIDDLEKSLRWLAKEKRERPSPENLKRARDFFTVFQENI